MLGGSLTRYHPPSRRTGQDGGAFTQDLIKLATPLLTSSLRVGKALLDRGQSWREAGKAALCTLGRGVKRKAQTSKSGIYKKATKRARDIFGV